MHLAEVVPVLNHLAQSLTQAPLHHVSLTCDLHVLLFIQFYVTHVANTSIRYQLIFAIWVFTVFGQFSHTKGYVMKHHA